MISRPNKYLTIKKITQEEIGREKRKPKRFWRVLSILLIILLIFVNTLWYISFHEAVQLGAENTVTGIEMTMVCMKIGNVTQQQIMDGYYNMFIKPKLEKQ